jgi:hypothetical protein
MPIKIDCLHCPPPPPPHKRAPQDWEMHPSWTTGVEALNAYNDWVNSVVMPVAFQWIEEHKPEVYAAIPEELKDDVGVVMAAAFNLVKELPAYKNGVEKRAVYEAAVADGTWDPSNTNPVWTGIVNKVRACTEKAFEEQSSLLGDIPK